jgi:uncharacterized LabA/DUF88 family protein
LYHTSRRLREKIDYVCLKESLDDCFGIGTPIHFFCSVDPQRSEQQEFIKILRSIGYIIHSSKLRRRKRRSGEISIVSKGLDVALAVSATTLPDKFKNIILLSGDSDFLPLVEAIKQQGREIALITLPLS